MRQQIERGLLCLGLVWLLAACGGGGGASTPPPVVVVPPPTVGASGGTVTEASGASVIVPAGALVADTTIRVAMDSTGAPVVPAGLVSAGNTYVITPHGGFFAQPVEVRIPAPNVTLLPTQELKLAKAEDEPASGPTRASSSSNKRYTPPAASTVSAPKPKRRRKELGAG